MSSALFDAFRLFVMADTFAIQPTEKPDELLIIDRVTQELRIESYEDQTSEYLEVKEIFGIVGIINLVAGPYLIAITKRKHVGTIFEQHMIWEVLKTELYAFPKTLLHLTDQQKQDNQQYIQLTEASLKMPSFYYSTTYDLTYSLQRLSHTGPDFLTDPMHVRADQRFLWNGHLITKYAHLNDMSRYCLPIMLGFISINQCSVRMAQFSYILISRKSCHRAGTRFFTRGIDLDGHVANFVETEQILVYDGNKLSFVQTRGSIPLFWSQEPNLHYKPMPVISDNMDHLAAFQSHFQEQVDVYGKNIIVNLIDSRGIEAALESRFASLVERAKIPNVIYEYFDFHRECSKMRWDRLSILLDRLEVDRADFGFFFLRKDNTVMNIQDGVFRTNCIDCLDRTNVVQNLLAKRTLQDHLRLLKIIREQDLVDAQLQVEKMLKNVWADNADMCSVQYAGTGALKTDFTRTGRRTHLGLLQDGWNATTRYFINNFLDGQKQDSIDLLLGNYAGGVQPPPLHRNKDWKFYSLPVVFLIAFAMFLISLLMPSESWYEWLLYLAFWGGSAVTSVIVILSFGTEFVDTPKLKKE